MIGIAVDTFFLALTGNAPEDAATTGRPGVMTMLYAI
jgi:hypothetical protein